MTRRRAWSIAAVSSIVGAGAFVPPSLAGAQEVAAWFVRPATLPFAWRALREASQNGDGEECFARGQQILHLLPSWTDGHAAFAYDYALGNDRVFVDAGERLDAAERRLRVAMAWLESARATAGRRELDLLDYLSMLPEIAARLTPGLSTRLAENGVAQICDAYLAEAERLFPTAAVREQRTFFGPTLAAGMLAAGNREGAILVLSTAIDRSPEVRDQALATEWRDRLLEVVRCLRGEPVDLTAVRADARMAPLLPHLR